jgi:hypothetical protein
MDQDVETATAISHPRFTVARTVARRCAMDLELDAMAWLLSRGSRHGASGTRCCDAASPGIPVRPRHPQAAAQPSPRRSRSRQLAVAGRRRRQARHRPCLRQELRSARPRSAPRGRNVWRIEGVACDCSDESRRMTWPASPLSLHGNCGFGRYGSARSESVPSRKPSGPARIDVR